MDANTSLMQRAFLFDDRKRFEAKRDRDLLRSSLPLEINVPPTADLWKLRPVDFSTMNFHPNRKKNTQPPSIEDTSPREKISRHSQIYNPAVMKPFEVQHDNLTKRKKHSNNDDNDFVLDPRIKYDKMKSILITDPYKNPKPHDFRQYPDVKQLDLPEFETKSDHDTGNIRFLTNHLNTLWLQERENERVPIIEKPVPEMYRALTARPKWEPRLILPKVAYPNKYAAFSRFRNPTRTVQSAYWERVEDSFDQRRKKR